MIPEHIILQRNLSRAQTIMGPICTQNAFGIRDVWSNNFIKEFESLLSTVNGSGPGTIMGFDVEFPGFFREEALWCSNREAQYQALRANVDLLMPIQIGVAVASIDGTTLNAWNFNLKFDADSDLHTESALTFLSRAGLRLGDHARFGIDASLFGQMLAGSPLVGSHDRVPLWVTLSGQYDFGYLVKVLTGQRLPSDNDAFQKHLDVLCSRRRELRDQCPYGSLDTLAFQNCVVRCGAAHTAGSDALTTLELYVALVGLPCFTSICPPPGLSMPPPPGLSLPCPPCISTTAEHSLGDCSHGGDAFTKRDLVLAAAIQSTPWPEDWRSSVGCEASALACPLGSKSSWRHHARRAMISGTARGIQAPVSCRMMMQGASHRQQCCWQTAFVA